MATSGSSSYNAEQLITAAFIEAGLPSSLVTAEHLSQAKLHLRRMMDSWAQQGVLLWSIEKRAFRVNTGQIVLDLPRGANKINEVYRRSYIENTDASPLISPGQIDTYIIVNDGYIYVADISVTYTGIPTSDMIISYSADGVDYVTVQTISKDNFTAGQENYIILDRVVVGAYLRVVMSGVVFTQQRIFTNPSDLPLTSLSRDVYNLLPNKAFLGDPIQFWPNRTASGYDLYLWPVPRNANWVIVVVYKRLLNDLESLTSQLDVPQSWYDAFIYGLAYRILVLVPNETRNDANELSKKSIDSLAIAKGDEADGTPLFLTPNIKPYTR